MHTSSERILARYGPGFTSPFPDPTPEQWARAEASETEGSERRARVEDECSGRTVQGPSLKRVAPPRKRGHCESRRQWRHAVGG